MDKLELDMPREGGPLYLQLRDQIRSALEQGIWKPGDLLPTEAQLSERFQVSPGTVKQSILALVQDGFLVRRSGKGTFVKRLDLEKSLARFFRFRDGVFLTDLGPEIQVLDLRVLNCPSKEIATKLQIPVGGKVLYLQRAMLQSKTPICLYRSYLPYQRVKGLERIKLDAGTLYDILEHEFGIHVVRAEEFLQASAARAGDARFLGVRKGTPVIFIERTAYSYQDAVVEFREIVGRGDKFRYQIELR